MITSFQIFSTFEKISKITDLINALSSIRVLHKISYGWNYWNQISEMKFTLKHSTQSTWTHEKTNYEFLNSTNYS